MKAWSSLARFGFETVEGGICWVLPDNTKKALISASSKIIDKSDSHLGGILSRVVPVVPLDPQVSIRGKVTNAQENWKLLKGKLTKKVSQSIEHGFIRVKTFSSTQLKSFIHIDLIEYASEVIDNAHNTAKPHYIRINKQLANAVLKLTSSVASVQECLRETPKRVSTELTERLKKAICQAHELAQGGVTLYHENKASMTVENLKQLPKKSLDFLMQSPALFHSLYEKYHAGDVCEGQAVGILKHIHLLLAAVHDVFLGPSPATKVEQKLSTVQHPQAVEACFEEKQASDAAQSSPVDDEEQESDHGADEGDEGDDE